MMREIRGKVLIVTGASSGIGRATALEAARAGMRLVLAARGQEALNRVAQQVRSTGGDAIVIPTDVADPAACDQLIEQTFEHYGRIDALFANAGFGFFHHAEDDSQQATERQMWQVNYEGAIRCARAALKRMTTGGHILICSSIAGSTGLPWKATYSATKAALHGFATTLRMELQPRGIYVTTIYPVGTKTNFSHTANQLSTDDSPRAKTPSWLEQTPEHVAKRIVTCMKKPRPELWPSRFSHLMASLWTYFPRFRGWALSKHV